MAIRCTGRRTPRVANRHVRRVQPCVLRRWQPELLAGQQGPDDLAPFGQEHTPGGRLTGTPRADHDRPPDWTTPTVLGQGLMRRPDVALVRRPGRGSGPGERNWTGQPPDGVARGVRW